MQSELAAAVVIGIAFVGFLVWAFALRMMLNVTRERQVIAHETMNSLEDETPAETITGSALVSGPAEELSAKLAAKLARDGLGFLGPVKIIAADRREVSFESTGNMGGPAGMHRGLVRLSGAGDKTRIEYAVKARSARVLIALGWISIALGLAALVIGVCLEFAFVINSPQAGVRFQAVQMIQAVHFLWPPFLFAMLARQPIRVIRTQLEALVNNLPYL